MFCFVCHFLLALRQVLASIKNLALEGYLIAFTLTSEISCIFTKPEIAGKSLIYDENDSMLRKHNL